jgi:asparagine synthase (glutamine-hydrolysing)
MTLLAGIVKDNSLVAEEDWSGYIDKLASATAEIIKDKNEAKNLLKQRLIAAVEKRTNNLNHFGIFFSGGVDSTVIATISKRLNKEFTCYTIGVEGAKDLSSATVVASEMSFPLKTAVLTLEEVDYFLRRVIKIIPSVDIVNVEVGIAVLAAIQLAKHNKDNVIFSGLGSEEIFAGYQRHAEAKDVNAECWNGLRNMWRRDLLRDFALAAANNVRVLTPFLDKELITVAMQLPAQWKIDNTEKKIILREVALDMGIPEKFAFRKKLAAQYGSNISKAVEKLAKMNGFKYKKDYLNSLELSDPILK